MKILFALEGPVKYGPNIWANSLYTELATRFRDNDENIIKQVKTKNIRSLIGAIFLARNFDIFHFYSESFGAALLFLLFKLFRKKTVYTLHGNMKIEAKIKPWPINWLWVPAHLFVMKNVDVVTFPSKYLMSEMEINFKLQKKMKKPIPNYYVIPNGIFVEEYPNNLVQQKSKRLKDVRRGDQPLRILSVTSFTFKPKTQGIDLLIEISTLLNDRGIKTEIKIGGIGPLLDSYKNRYEYHNIKFLGYCDSNKENRWADIFLHFSYLDVFPLVILDAGSIGLPSMASNIGGIPEIFHSNQDKFVWGLVPNKANIIVEKIIDLISDDNKYLTISKEQFSNIEEHFSLSSTSNQFWNLYTNLFFNSANF